MSAFTTDQLKDAIQHSLANEVVTPEKRVAFFTGVTTNGVEAVLAVKLGNGWDLNVLAKHEFEHGDTEAGVMLHWSH